jgi:hypothetical protein
MNTKKLFIGLFIAALTFTSCSDDEGVDFQPVSPVIPETPSDAYENGILVINQGGFGQGDGSVSYLSDDLSITQNNIFNNVNDELLGDTALSMAFKDNLAYVVLHGSGKIKIVNRYTFKSIGVIDEGLINPRYMAFANGKAYVTNWGDATDANDDFVAVVDLNSNTITSTIPVAEGPEQIINANGSLYITNKGGYNTGNIITKIDSNNTVTTINTGDSPDEIFLDNDNNLWVLCEGAGYPNYDTYGSLIKINTNNDTISKTIDFGKNIYESSIVYENGSIYFYYGSEIYKMNEDDTNLPANPIITQNLDYGSMAIKNNILYGTLPNYTDGVSDIYIYDLDTNSLQNTFELGNGGFNIYFN